MARQAPVGIYESLDFNSPLTDETADRLVAALAATAPGHIIDVGCGWAELLLRLLASCPDATAIGIDNDDVLIERARANAKDRSLLDRVAFRAEIGEPDPADLVTCVGAEHAIGTLEQALVRLRSMVRPGGRLFLGTAFWEQTPSPDVLADFGRLPRLDELVAIVVEHGWRPLGLAVATLEDWDHFEFGFLADWEQFVMHPADATDADLARKAADRHRTGYLERRGVLGFAYLTLGRPAADRAHWPAT